MESSATIPLERKISRGIRVVWAIVFTAIAIALTIGAIQAFNKSKTNPWVNIPFQGQLQNGIVQGTYYWSGQNFALSWPSLTVPDHIQLNTANPGQLRLEGLTGKEERDVSIKMLVLAGVILIVAWAITYYTWTHGRLIDIS